MCADSEADSSELGNACRGSVDSSEATATFATTPAVTAGKDRHMGPSHNGQCIRLITGRFWVRGPEDPPEQPTGAVKIIRLVKTVPLRRHKADA